MNNSNMGSDYFHEFKRQASLFFTEKIKTARLALTDITPAELLTEEATNGHPWPQDTRTMRIISRAAFEVDDYWRITEILHKRLSKFDRKDWRVSYKALILLEHLLTHGPRRVAEDFQGNRHAIKEMGSFQYVDERGFDWGSSVANLSERVLKLLESEPFLMEERATARKITHGIQGFGSFGLQSSPDTALKNSSFKAYGRSNSCYNDHRHHKNELLASSNSSVKEGTSREQQIYQYINPVLKEEDDDSDSWLAFGEGYAVEDHPFSNTANQTLSSLLSNTK